MAELLIDSVPSGAQVQIDGEIISTTPLTMPIEIGLEGFRAECLSDGDVVCSWAVLRNRLEDQTASRLWWNLTRDERYSVAEMAIKNTLFSKIYYMRTGKPNCEGGEGDWGFARCVGNAIIRCLKFAGRPADAEPDAKHTADECYYKQSPIDDEHCFVSDTPYGLPCHYTSRITEGTSNHALAAIQIVDAVDSIDNWIVFQYSSFDIKPGHSQMPRGSRVSFSRSYVFQCGASYGTQLAEFWI